MRASARRRSYTIADKVKAFGRLCRTALGAVRPGAERPPLPDLNVANVGGAFVPALERRWKADRRSS